MKTITKEMKKERKSKKEENEIHLRLMEKAAQRKKLEKMCKDYDPRPVLAMTDKEIKDFAARQAVEAAYTTRIKDRNNASGWRRMTQQEINQYAQVIMSSVKYFNDKSEEHRRLLDYREECRRTEEQLQHKQNNQNKESKNFIIKVM